jgi:hypothetical protein
MVEATAGERAGRAVAATASRQWALACDASQGLGVKRIDWFRASEARLVANPQTAILLPWKVGQEVVLGIYVVAERAGAEESVHEATIGKLTKDLGHAYLAKIVNEVSDMWMMRERWTNMISCGYRWHQLPGIYAYERKGVVIVRMLIHPKQGTKAALPWAYHCR